MARVVLPASKIKARRKRRRLTILFIVGVGVLFFGTLLVWFLNSSVVRITAIEVKGVQTVATSTVAEHVQKRLAGSYLYLLPKDNIFLYPKGYLIASLLKDMPVLASAHISAENFQTISVSVVERQPKALWCGASASRPEPCFLLDERGLAYGASLNFSGNAYIKYYGALVGSTTPKHYISETEFRSLSALVDTIAASQKSESVASVWVDAHKDVRLAFVSGFTLIFTTSMDGGDLYQRFMLALQSDVFKAHALSDFEYLDLRFGDKVSYKLK